MMLALKIIGGFLLASVIIWAVCFALYVWLWKRKP